MIYGGLPAVVLLENTSEKEEYLKNIFTHTYLKDIKDRYNIFLDHDLEELISILASSIGCLTNPHKLADTFRSVKHSSITQDTIKKYIDYLEDAFLIKKAIRYDIKGKHYIDTPLKYYFEDLGVRNARLNFRQVEYTHLMENLIYNELCLRGYSVDVGQVIKNVKNSNGNSMRQSLEVDFVCNKGSNRIYIQSALSLDTEEKMQQELRSLSSISDNYPKIIIVGGMQPTYRNDAGIQILNISDFLLNENVF